MKNILILIISIFSINSYGCPLFIKGQGVGGSIYTNVCNIESYLVSRNFLGEVTNVVPSIDDVKYLENVEILDNILKTNWTCNKTILTLFESSLYEAHINAHVFDMCKIKDLRPYEWNGTIYYYINSIHGETGDIASFIKPDNPFIVNIPLYNYLEK